MMDIKAGDWVVTNHPYMRGYPPAYVAEVLSVGKNVKAKYPGGMRKFSLLKHDEIHAVFPDEVSARAAAARAKTAWGEYAAQVSELEAALGGLKRERRNAARRELGVCDES